MIDWQKITGDKRLKFLIGLMVVVVLLVIFSLDLIISIYSFRKNISFETEEVEEYIAREEVPAPATKEAKEIKKRKAKIAIILDDAGSDLSNYAAIFSIKQPLTIGIIPCLPTSFKIAERARKAGIQVILHLPMEPKNSRYSRNYGGMINCASNDNEIKKLVLEDFSSVKLAVGFNNHMGSKATEDERVMKAVFSSIDPKMFFVDSRTSRNSIALKYAKNHNIRSGENNIFLDGTTKESEIEDRFRTLVTMARYRGYAIGIGHATRRATISVLSRLMPEYSKNGIKFVHASELVK